MRYAGVGLAADEGPDDTPDSDGRRAIGAAASIWTNVRRARGASSFEGSPTLPPAPRIRPGGGRAVAARAQFAPSAAAEPVPERATLFASPVRDLLRPAHLPPDLADVPPRQAREVLG